jgi:hypothetical protein
LPGAGDVERKRVSELNRLSIQGRAEGIDEEPA